MHQRIKEAPRTCRERPLCARINLSTAVGGVREVVRGIGSSVDRPVPASTTGADRGLHGRTPQPDCPAIHRQLNKTYRVCT